MTLRIEAEVPAEAIRELRERLEVELERALMKTALLVERGAKLNAPVDTGFLRNSIRAVPPVPGVSGDLEAFVVVGAEYGAYVEYGYFVRRSRERKRTGYGKKGTIRLAASRLATREHGTFVVGRYYLTRAALEGGPALRAAVSEAIQKARGE